MLDEVAAHQHGVITTKQARAAGCTTSAIRAKVRSGRWQRVFPGVYATFSGPLSRTALLWAVVLRAGPGAVLSHETAAELAGLTEKPSTPIHITVPANRKVRPIAGVAVHRSSYLATRTHPTWAPPQTRLEETIIDLTQTARGFRDAQGWLARAIGARRTTHDRLIAAIHRRPKVRWRRLLVATLADVSGGSHSVLELAFLCDVVRAHRLPAGVRQHPSGTRTRRYDDVRYPKYRLRVELDGHAAHPEHERWRDLARDNDAVVAGDRVLRYGFADVVGDPCAVAHQVAWVLRDGGWTGRPSRCQRPGCLLS